MARQPGALHRSRGAALIHLLTGGARSGKSRRALDLARAHPGPIRFIATAEAKDEEMRERITRHRQERGPRFTTVEAPIHVEAAVAADPTDEGGAVILDCLTLWCANLLFAGLDDAAMHARFSALAETMASANRPVFVVTNEVGLGIIPGDPLSRRYADLLGRLNQEVAARAKRVTLMIAGIPLVVR